MGNAAGALAAGKRGAIPSMPGLDDIMECIRSVPKLK
jgi:sugar/nucleoside kinase (ribokinase family)